MKPRVDLQGFEFGILLVDNRSEKRDKNRNVYWDCTCRCGNKTTVRTDHLKSGDTTSCGCVQEKRFKEKKVKHGLSGHPLYTRWRGIKHRCYNPKHRRYKYYGGKGITMCKEWVNDFKAFYDWSMSNGYSKELEIDRKEVDKGYSPENCRYITKTENINRSRRK